MNARDLIVEADQLAREKGMNQREWSAKSGYARNGQTVSRIMKKGDCRLSTFIALLKAANCEIEIKKVDEK